MAHVRESDSQLRNICPAQGRRQEEGNLVANQHEVSRSKAPANAPGGIGQKEDLSSHQLHQTDRHNHLFHLIALIVMNPSLHDDGRRPGHMAKDIASHMSRHRRLWKSRNLLIGNQTLQLHAVSEITQTGPQNQSHPGCEGNAIPYALIGPQHLFISRIHITSSPVFYRRSAPETGPQKSLTRQSII